MNVNIRLNPLGANNLIKTSSAAIITDDVRVLNARGLTQEKYRQLFDIQDVAFRGRKKMREEWERMRFIKHEGRAQNPANYNVRKDILSDKTNWEYTFINGNLFLNTLYSSKRRELSIPNSYVYKNKVFYNNEEVIFNDGYLINNTVYSKQQIIQSIVYDLYACCIRNRKAVIVKSNCTLYDLQKKVPKSIEVSKMLRGNKFFIKQDNIYYHLDIEQNFSAYFCWDLSWLFLFKNKVKQYYSEESILLREYFGITKKLDEKQYKSMVKRKFYSDISEFCYGDFSSSRKRVGKIKNISESTFMLYLLAGLPSEICMEYFNNVILRIKNYLIK